MKTFLGFCVLLSCSCGGSDNTVIDGGNDATTSDSPSSDGNNNDVATSDSGNDGSANDSGTNDSGTGKDSGTGGDGGAFACYMASCDPATSYCHLQEVGPQPADGGFAGSGVCLPYPTTCGSTPSCSCVTVGAMCMCAQSGPDITVTCGGV